MTKTRQYNDVTDRTGPLYTKIETKLLWPIRRGIVYGEDQIGQWHDWFYRCDLCRNQNWIIMTDKTKCDQSRKPDRITMWLMVNMWSL